MHALWGDDNRGSIPKKGKSWMIQRWSQGTWLHMKKILDFCCHHEVRIMKSEVLLKIRTQKSENNFIEECI